MIRLRHEKDKKIEDTIIKDVRNNFRLKKRENGVIKNRVIRDIRNLFEHEEDEIFTNQ